jgi:hypothetical protein
LRGFLENVHFKGVAGQEKPLNGANTESPGPFILKDLAQQRAGKAKKKKAAECLPRKVRKTVQN